MRARYNRLLQIKRPWICLMAAALGASYLYVFSEWLFVITKPSFMNGLSFRESIGLYFFASSLIFLGCFGMLCFMALLSHISFLKEREPIFLLIGSLIPAFVLSSLILLAVNNFTHTVLHFGIINSTGIVRAIYALFFLTTFGFCIRTVLDILPRISDGYR